MDEEYVRLTKKLYGRLLATEMKLEALEQAGVDNWSGYDVAMDILKEMQEEPK